MIIVAGLRGSPHIARLAGVLSAAAYLVLLVPVLFLAPARYDLANYQDWSGQFVNPIRAGVVAAFIALAGRFVGLTAAQARQSGGILATIENSSLRREAELLLAKASTPDSVVRSSCAYLETVVRQMVRGSGETESRSRVSLMESTFSEKNPVVTMSDDPQIQRGAMDLFRGLMAFYGNRGAHEVQTIRQAEALDIVMWTDNLMRLLNDAREGRRT